MATTVNRGDHSPLVRMEPDHPRLDRIQTLINRVCAAVRWFFRLLFPCCSATPPREADRLEPSPVGAPIEGDWEPEYRPLPVSPTRAPSAELPHRDRPVTPPAAAAASPLLERFQLRLGSPERDLHPIVWHIRSVKWPTIPANTEPPKVDLEIAINPEKGTEANQQVESLNLRAELFNKRFDRALENLRAVESPLELCTALETLRQFVNKEEEEAPKAANSHSYRFAQKKGDLEDYQRVATLWFYCSEARNNPDLFDRVSLLYVASYHVGIYQNRFLPRLLNRLCLLYREVAQRIIQETPNNPALQDPETDTAFKTEFNDISRRVSQQLECTPVCFRIQQ